MFARGGLELEPIPSTKSLSEYLEQNIKYLLVFLQIRWEEDDGWGKQSGGRRKLAYP